MSKTNMSTILSVLFATFMLFFVRLNEIAGIIEERDKNEIQIRYNLLPKHNAFRDHPNTPSTRKM